MEGAASSTAPQPVVGGEEQGEVGLAVHGGGDHPDSHFTSAILYFQLLSYSELFLRIIARHRQCDVCSMRWCFINCTVSPLQYKATTPE